MTDGAHPTKKLLMLATVALVGAAAPGCENKCDELVTVLTDCVSNDVGATETVETTDTTQAPQPAGNAECSADDTKCSTCILESKLDLCTEYGKALAACRSSGDCQ